MDEKESTVSGSFDDNSAESTESPPPISSSEFMLPHLHQPPPPPAPQQQQMNFSNTAPLGNSNSDGVAKKKRGRPRKYDADGNLRVRPAPASFHSVVSSQQQEQGSGGGFSLSFGGSGHVAASAPPQTKRGRGRPPGSGNWQLLASLGGIFADTAGGDFTPHVVTVNTGEDVAVKILSFSQKGSRGVCVLSATGAVSNVTIRQPGSSGGILTYEGRFEILTLTGSYTVTETCGAKNRTGGLSISLASPDGRVIGGGVAGSLLAASPIQIVVGSFMPGYIQQKRKYQRHNATATPVADPAPAARPVSQPTPNSETCLTPTSMFAGQSYARTDIAEVNKQTHQANNAQNDCWNGIGHSSDQRPSPDINVSLLSEEDVPGVF